jgi:hypothetical protein
VLFPVKRIQIPIERSVGGAAVEEAGGTQCDEIALPWGADATNLVHAIRQEVLKSLL